LEIRKAKSDVSSEVLERLFKEVDIDESNSISLEEFEIGIENAKKRASEVAQIKDPLQTVFDLMDTSDPYG